MSPLEIVAFIVSVLGVWLTTRRSLWNFPFSLLSVLLYAVIFYQVKLYADMALQGVFAATLLYGLWQWLRGRKADGEIRVARIGVRELLISALAGAATAAVLGFGLYSRTDASLPWMDSLLFAGSLVASVWAARRRVANWTLWIVVDLLYVVVYLLKHLYLTALLYGLFVLLAGVGLREWRAALRRTGPADSAGRLGTQPPLSADAG